MCHHGRRTAQRATGSRPGCAELRTTTSIGKQKLPYEEAIYAIDKVWLVSRLRGIPRNRARSGLDSIWNHCTIQRVEQGANTFLRFFWTKIGTSRRPAILTRCTNNVMDGINAIFGPGSR